MHFILASFTLGLPRAHGIHDLSKGRKEETQRSWRDPVYTRGLRLFLGHCYNFLNMRAEKLVRLRPAAYVHSLIRTFFADSFFHIYGCPFSFFERPPRRAPRTFMNRSETVCHCDLHGGP
ncbi:hypothetical protein JR316_0001347 [Psilocybe cubensis]|uniref:Uncharacterized protein n=2 Tax=Psilocybe cubensis TaxID=181762 RepID=A0A8H8CS12_PSICU|nr:hypothetical protein JR316_0001347 [Psilocybe cubensis]KAH9487277.1 hypothetical protein JR316_0001347 [Psilocybe cubensis]